MEGLFGILILTLLLLSINGQVLSKDLGNVNIDSALNLMTTGLGQFSQGVETIIVKRLEEDKIIIEKNMRDMLESFKKDIVDEQMEFVKKLSSQSTANDEKIIDLLSTIRTDQRLQRQEIVSLREELKDFHIFYNESLSTVQTEQRLLRWEMMSVTKKLSEKVNEKLSYLNSSFQTGQQHLRNEMASLTTNLSTTIDILLNQEINNLNKAFDGLSDQIQNEQAATVTLIDSVARKANQTVSVCTAKIGENFDNIETNIQNVFRDEMEKVTLVREIESAKTKNVLEKISNTSLHMVEQFSSGEALKLLRNVEVISQSLLKVHGFRRDAGFDCLDILEKYPNTRGRNGVYNITAPSSKPEPVYCDMTTDYGGWTVIQRRVNGSVDFYRNWTEYKNGFGFADHEYWIGNDVLHRLTSLKPQELRIDIERFNGEKAYAVYSSFSVGDEASKYKLQLNGYSGNAGDSLGSSNEMKFTTRDQDNDESSFNCATDYRSAGWFKMCLHANPNGQFTDSEKVGSKYIVWYYWKYSWISLKSIKLMIRHRA